MSKVGTFIKKNRRGLLMAGAVVAVAAGHLEFIPYTVTGAMSFLGTSTAAVIAADRLDKALTHKEDEKHDDVAV